MYFAGFKMGISLGYSCRAVSYMQHSDQKIHFRKYKP